MSTKRLAIVFALLGLAVSTAAAPVREASEAVRTFAVGDQPALEVSNIWGNVTVVSGPPGQIEVALKAVRSAADAENFELSKTAIPLVIDQSRDTVVVRVGRQQRNWNNGPRCRRCKLAVQFTITVPKDTSVDVATVNDGVVTINDVGGTVSASNINGPVHIAGLERCDDINSINGAVLIDYKTLPNKECSVQTMNGDIVIGLPSPPAIDLAVDLGNGKIRSDFEVTPRAMAATVEQRSSGDKTIYDIEQMAGLRIGRGGAMLKIKSMNGNVQISRSNNDD